MFTVGVFMGSDLDHKIMEECLQVLQQFEVPYNIEFNQDNMVSENIAKWLKNIEDEGCKVIIVGDTADIYMARMIAGLTTIPVIAVPIRKQGLEDKDIKSLLDIVQPGSPVATVGINGARNAALLAIAVLGITDTRLKNAIKAFRDKMSSEVMAKDEALQESLLPKQC